MAYPYGKDPVTEEKNLLELQKLEEGQQESSLSLMEKILNLQKTQKALENQEAMEPNKEMNEELKQTKYNMDILLDQYRAQKFNDPFSKDNISRFVNQDSFQREVLPFLGQDGIMKSVTDALKLANRTLLVHGKQIKYPDGSIGYDLSNLTGEDRNKITAALNSVSYTYGKLQDAVTNLNGGLPFSTISTDKDGKSVARLTDMGSMLNNFFRSTAKNILDASNYLTKVQAAFDPSFKTSVKRWFLPKNHDFIFQAGNLMDIEKNLHSYEDAFSKAGLLGEKHVPTYAPSPNQKTIISSPDVMDKTYDAISNSKKAYEDHFPGGFGLSSSYGILAPKNLVAGWIQDDKTGKKTYTISSYGASLPIGQVINSMNPEDQNKLLGEIYNSPAKPEYLYAHLMRDWMYKWGGSFGMKHMADGKMAYVTALSKMGVSPQDISRTIHLAGNHHTEEEFTGPQ